MTARPRRAIVVLSVFVLGVLGACSQGRDDALVVDDPGVAEADYEYLIPKGTGDRIRAGDDVEILPAQLDVYVDETIRIVNEDNEGHFVGIFYVGAGETVTQRFSSPGEYTGQCTIHPSGKLLLRIHA